MPNSMSRQLGDENPEDRSERRPGTDSVRPSAEWAHTLASALVRAIQAPTLGEYMRVLVLVLAVALVAMAVVLLGAPMLIG
jgi:hypothetical protein